MANEHSERGQRDPDTQATARSLLALPGYCRITPSAPVTGLAPSRKGSKEGPQGDHVSFLHSDSWPGVRRERCARADGFASWRGQPSFSRDRDRRGSRAMGQRLPWGCRGWQRILGPGVDTGESAAAPRNRRRGKQACACGASTRWVCGAFIQTLGSLWFWRQRRCGQSESGDGNKLCKSPSGDGSDDSQYF